MCVYIFVYLHVESPTCCVPHPTESKQLSLGPALFSRIASSHSTEDLQEARWWPGPSLRKTEAQRTEAAYATWSSWGDREATGPAPGPGASGSACGVPLAGRGVAPAQDFEVAKPRGVSGLREG